VLTRKIAVAPCVCLRLLSRRNIWESFCNTINRLRLLVFCQRKKKAFPFSLKFLRFSSNRCALTRHDAGFEGKRERRRKEFRPTSCLVAAPIFFLRREKVLEFLPFFEELKSLLGRCVSWYTVVNF
jgi:hypothetical protein